MLVQILLYGGRTYRPSALPFDQHLCHDMTAIQKLPEEVISQLRSSFVIQSLPACLVELVQNALDARATSIEIGVGLDSWQCSVTDNGCGIEYSSLRRVGTRYSGCLFTIDAVNHC